MIPEENKEERPALPLPSVMDWEELESGLDGQLPLPTVLECPTLAERAFLSLARSWAKQLGELPEHHAPPRDFDLLALSALAIAFDRTDDFTNVARQQVRVNIALCHERGSSGWLDSIVWSLMEVRHLQNLHDSTQMQELVANLNHHNSAIRIWMMEIAWVMRAKLPRDKVLPLLLENVASTLAGVDKAWGLASILFEDRDTFLEAASDWSPGNDFNDQYAERVEQLKDVTFACQATFWKMEATIFRMVLHTLCEYRKIS